MKKLLAVPLLLLQGCTFLSSTEPYVQVSLGYAFNQTDYKSRLESKVAGCYGAVHFEGGLESKDGVTVGFGHDSFLECGRPFNSHNEPTRDYIFIGKKFGGQ